MPVVEEYARAHILTDDDQNDQEDVAVQVVLRYDPLVDPREVRIGLPGTYERAFPRSLLEQGLRAPAGAGEVRVWPCGRAQSVIELHSAQGVSVVQFETRTLLRFLRRVHRAAAAAAAAAVHG
ncbi:SsgA family sporulation/cell division regulator [Streptomyces thermoalcalitolerans]|uniref:SsgA family sporulation/cell division regulator n=1 Tax=Streptomyces thermoalcalitolerans TaxID=65605 RepID=A0ABP3Z6A8_9ACTN